MGSKVMSQGNGVRHDIGYSGGIYRCRAFSYLMPAMDSIIEATANRLRIRGDSFHTRFLGL